MGFVFRFACMLVNCMVAYTSVSSVLYIEIKLFSKCNMI